MNFDYGSGLMKKCFALFFFWHFSAKKLLAATEGIDEENKKRFTDIEERGELYSGHQLTSVLVPSEGMLV